MALLKKLKSSTLMETLVASVLIVITFIMASLVLNNLFSNSVNNNTRQVFALLNELEYSAYNNTLELPYENTYNDWRISAKRVSENNNDIIEIEFVNKKVNKSIKKRINDFKN